MRANIPTAGAVSNLHVKIIQLKKLTARLNLLIAVLCCEMLIIQFLFSLAEEGNMTVSHHTSSTC